MKLNSAQLGRQLQGQLAAVYVVSGDDPLLCQEASDAIRSASRARGFSERQVLHVDKSFDWGLLYQAAASLSLFAEKRLIELRIDSGKPGDQGATALIDYLQRPAEDTLLLISLPRLDGSTQKSKWAKALIDSPHSQFVQIWPVETAQLPGWIRQRLADAGLSASAEAIELIAARVEGNLLAAAQEIEKLKLGATSAQITAENVLASVGDSARFDVFGLIDAALGGDAVHSLRMLEGLRGEGEEPLFILAILTRELRLLASLALQMQQSVPLEKAFASARPPVWDKRRPLLQKALQRHRPGGLSSMLLQAQQIDAQVKGQAPGNPWNSLTQLLLQLAGKPLKLAEASS
jgi:DNA polymerase-3 subunit delta